MSFMRLGFVVEVREGVGAPHRCVLVKVHQPVLRRGLVFKAYRLVYVFKAHRLVCKAHVFKAHRLVYLRLIELCWGWTWKAF